MALWYMANHEAVDNVKTWDVVNEDNIWYTQSIDGSAIYAFVNDEDWKWMQSRSFLLKPVKGNNRTTVHILGQNKEVMEYTLDISPEPIFETGKNGLFVNIIKAQRLNKTWDNPVVIKIQHATYAGAE